MQIHFFHRSAFPLETLIWLSEPCFWRILENEDECVIRAPRGRKTKPKQTLLVGSADVMQPLKTLDCAVLSKCSQNSTGRAEDFFCTKWAKDLLQGFGCLWPKAKPEQLQLCWQRSHPIGALASSRVEPWPHCLHIKSLLQHTHHLVLAFIVSSM